MRLLYVLVILCIVQCINSRYSRKINNKDPRLEFKKSFLTRKPPFKHSQQNVYNTRLSRGRVATVNRGVQGLRPVSLPRAPPRGVPRVSRLPGSTPPRVLGSSPPRIPGSTPPRIPGSPSPRLPGSTPPRTRPAAGVDLQDNRWSPIGLQISKQKKKPTKPYKKPIFPKKSPYPKQRTKFGRVPTPADISRIDVVTPGRRIEVPRQFTPNQPKFPQQVPARSTPSSDLGPYSEVDGIKIYKFHGTDGRGIYRPEDFIRLSKNERSDPSQQGVPVQWSQAQVFVPPAQTATVQNTNFLQPTSPPVFSYTGPPTPAPPFPTVHTTTKPNHTSGPVIIIAQSNVAQN